jgi:hypothetical protein
LTDASILSVIGGALTLNGDQYRALLASAHPLRVSVAVLLLIGLSWTLGNSAVLFFNHVPPDRFVVTVLTLAVSFVLGILLWTGSIWLLAVVLFGVRGVPLWTIVTIAAFGYAPVVLSVLVLIPHLGLGLETVLNTWALLAMLVAVMVSFNMGFFEALVCTLLGWCVVKLAPRFAHGRLGRVFNTAWYQVSGKQARAIGEAAAVEASARLRNP